uniref:IRG-type G domain-containing protein n=1 Tax=Cyprinus carpio TaxID=7962 RepID=A0A8C1IW43_CYPCA
MFKFAIQNMENLDPAVVDVIKESGESTLEKAKAKAKTKFDQFVNVSLNIAVTGKTGSGKSSFVNAVRGLEDDDDGAAPTGVTETTMEPTMYEHPEMPNVKLWDLPGIGSPNFKAKKYLKDVKFNTYDFFIILTSERFTENDIMLAEEIRKQKKSFYFVRSKIDNDMSSEKKKKGFDEQKVLSKIREDCQKNLKELGNPRVFLISSCNVEKYDFESLQNTLEDELPEHKKYALLQAWPVCSAASLEKKINMFKRMTWAASLVSAGVAVVPVPGLSAACDVGMVVLFLTRCYYAFGLDERSLTRLSEKVNKPHLKDLAKSKFVTAIREKALTRLQASAALAAIATVEYLLSLLPGVGSVAAAGISFATTQYLLREGVNDLADTARIIRKEAGLASVH